MKTLIPILILFFALAGCAEPPNINQQVSADTLKMVNTCRDHKQALEILELNKVDGIPDSHKSFVLMHRDTMSMIESVWGKDQCMPGTTQFDVWAAYYQNHKEEVIAAINAGKEVFKDITKYGALGYVGGKAVDKMGDTSIKVNGDGNSDIGSTDVDLNLQQQIGQETGPNNNGVPEAPAEVEPVEEAEVGSE